MISKNLVRCIAKLSGDGYLCLRYIRYANTCEELIKEFEEDIQMEFGNVVFTRGVVNSGTPFILIHRKKIINTFLKYLPDYRSNSVFIPYEIKNSELSIQSEYLRAIFDDEGCAAIRVFSKTKEWKRNITLSSNSLRLLKDAKALLVSFNIQSNRIYRNRQGCPRDKSYVLSISGKMNISNFADFIGFKHPKKSRKLDIMIKSYNCTSKHKERFKELKNELECSHLKRCEQRI